MMIQALSLVVVRLGGQVRPLKAGEVLTLSDAQGWKLKTKAGNKVRQVPLGPCFSCGSARRWISIYGATVCAACHPPVDGGLVKEWIGERDKRSPAEERSHRAES